jgi:hypothetical protein
MGDQVTVQVECYSGSAYAERPEALFWQGTRIKILKILKTWRTPDGKAFTVELETGSVATLFYNEQIDTWTTSALT